MNRKNSCHPERRRRICFLPSTAFRNQALLVVAFLICAAMGGSAQQIQVSGTNRTIAITTTEEAERRADTAIVHIGYHIYASTSSEVTEQAAKTSKAITEALTNAGIAKDAIESDTQGTGPVQEYQKNQFAPEVRANRKFEAQQSWSVRTQAAGAATALAVAVGAGANQSGAIDWSVADESSLSAEAAGKALKHAQVIADQMALGLGAKLGPLVYASNEAQQLRVLPLAARGLGDGFNTDASSMSTEVSSILLILNTPMVRRSATVSAVFSLQ